MNSRAMRAMLIGFTALTGAALILGQETAGRSGRGPGRGRGPAGPPLREYTIIEIPGIVAAGAKWELVWQGTATESEGGKDLPEGTKLHGGNADGIVGTKDGGILFAQEQTNQVRKLDRDGKVSIYIENTHGTGAVGIDAKGRILGVERTCTDPGLFLPPDYCEKIEPPAVAILHPNSQRKVLADKTPDGRSLGRLNDLVIDKRGGVYFNGGGTFYVDPNGKVTEIMGLDGNPLQSNGLQLSPDEKIFYATNGGGLVAYDINEDGTVKNGRKLITFENGGGDGSAIDSKGNIYVTANFRIEVVSPEGKLLGEIPCPRGPISVAFSGPGKKTLYMVGTGALGSDGKEYTTPMAPVTVQTKDGPVQGDLQVRANAKTIYKLSTLSEGFPGRAK